MKIRWHGHACFEVSNSVTVVTDPHDGKSIGISPPVLKADIVLVSHDHFDHNCIRIVKGLSVDCVNKAGERTVKGVKIRGIGSYHDESQGMKRGSNIIFKFELEDVKFCHLGDLGHLLDDVIIKEIGDVDILFTPIGSVFTIDADKAWEITKAINPKVVIPMHYRVGGLSLNIKPPEPFLEKSERVYKKGNEVDFEKEDLPEELEVWFFSL